MKFPPSAMSLRLVHITSKGLKGWCFQVFSVMQHGPFARKHVITWETPTGAWNYKRGHLFLMKMSVDGWGMLHAPGGICAKNNCKLQGFHYQRDFGTISSIGCHWYRRQGNPTALLAFDILRDRKPKRSNWEWEDPFSGARTWQRELKPHTTLRILVRRVINPVARLEGHLFNQYGPSLYLPWN